MGVLNASVGKRKKSSLCLCGETVFSVSLGLEQGVNEGRDGGGLGENQEHSHQEQEHQDRQQPPLFAHLQKFPKLQNYPDFTHLGVPLGSNLSEHKKCYNDEPFCEMSLSVK
jgi:hypothetical protein